MQIGLEPVIKDINLLENLSKNLFQTPYNHLTFPMYYTKLISILMRVRNIKMFSHFLEGESNRII